MNKIDERREQMLAEARARMAAAHIPDADDEKADLDELPELSISDEN